MKTFCAVLFAVSAAASASSHEGLRFRQLATNAEFCWRTSQGRGIGQIPQSCAAGQERLGLLCYPNCPANFRRTGVDCHSVCPAGMEDQGLFCRLNEYGRGAGYAWQFGDPLNDSGMFRRCENAWGRGNCEKNGLVVYPKCRAGFYAFGCCICRPYPPNCAALGLGGQLDLSCAKRIIIGDPQLGTCSATEDRDAGLCYPKCPSGFRGVGPVCWGQPPTGWVECGMGAATTTLTCANTIKDQIISVGQLVLNICTLFSSSSAKVLTAPAEVSKLTELKNAWTAIKSKPIVQKATEAYKSINQNKKGYTAIEELEKATTTEDYVRFAATIASILDPSGVASVIAAYTYPTCDKVRPLLPLF